MSAATIGVVLSFEHRSESGIQWAEVKVDLGGEDPVTAIYYPPAGVDEWPLPGDSALLIDGPGLGLWYCVGFRDPKLAPIASGPGETVLFSRSAPGVLATKCVLKPDGSAVINDDVTITADGDVVAGSISLKSHTHGYIDSIDSPPVATPSETDPPS